MWFTKKLTHNDFILLESIKSKITPLLSNPKHAHFTDHKITHSERIIDIIRLILNGYSKLGKDEWFILLAATYLHDIGMQIKREDLLLYPDLDRLLSESKLTKDDLDSVPKLLNFIRDWHHLFSYYMITNLFKDHLGLNYYRYVEDLALVAQGHRKVDLSSEQYKKRGIIRVDLLSALLRLADEFDCDNNRADLDQLLVQELSIGQKMYWFFHFCVDKLEIRNHYLKIYAKVPKGFSAKFRLLFIIPIYKKYLEILEVFEREGIVLAWALSDITESEDMTRIFQKEEGLLEHIEENSRNIKDIFRLEEHLDEEEILSESIFDLEVSPFYSTGIEKFDGIRIKKWPKDTHYCQYLIFNTSEEIKDDLIPENTLWKSETVKIDETNVEWPKLVKEKEYGFLIYLFENKIDEFPLQNLKGKFRILENEKIESVKRLLRTIENPTLSAQDRRIIQAGLEIGIGNYEKALLIMQPLLKQSNPGQIEILDKINSVYEAIIFEMKRFDWVNQANRIDEIRYSLIFQFSRDSHKYLISDKLESEKIDSDKEVENVLSLNTLTREGNCKNNQVKLDKLSISKELPNKKETTKQSSTRKMTKDNLKVDFDIFICHASEDKKEVALPLAAHLQELGLSVWLDESELTLGDSLRQNIDRGLTRSRYGAVILSPAFFDKEWPNRELDGLLAREDGNEKIILPIWHNVNKHEVEQFSPILAGKVAVSTLRGIANVAEKIVNAVSR